jgi:hypothetical protein
MRRLENTEVTAAALKLDAKLLILVDFAIGTTAQGLIPEHHSTGWSPSENFGRTSRAGAVGLRTPIAVFGDPCQAVTPSYSDLSA